MIFKQVAIRYAATKYGGGGRGGNISVENDNTVRIYFQNINSCGFAKGTDKWGKIIESMSIAECDFIIVAQTSFNWNILSNRNNMHDKTRHKIPIDKLYMQEPICI